MLNVIPFKDLRCKNYLDIKDKLRMLVYGGMHETNPKGKNPNTP